MGSKPWPLLKSARPRMADLPVNAGCLNPSHLATTEFTPSLPTKTYSITALMYKQLDQKIPIHRVQRIRASNLKLIDSDEEETQ